MVLPDLRRDRRKWRRQSDREKRGSVEGQVSGGFPHLGEFDPPVLGKAELDQKTPPGPIPDCWLRIGHVLLNPTGEDHEIFQVAGVPGRERNGGTVLLGIRSFSSRAREPRADRDIELRAQKRELWPCGFTSGKWGRWHRRLLRDVRDRRRRGRLVKLRRGGRAGFRRSRGRRRRGRRRCTLVSGRGLRTRGFRLRADLGSGLCRRLCQRRQLYEDQRSVGTRGERFAGNRIQRDEERKVEGSREEKKSSQRRPGDLHGSYYAMWTPRRSSVRGSCLMPGPAVEAPP